MRHVLGSNPSTANLNQPTNQPSLQALPQKRWRTECAEGMAAANPKTPPPCRSPLPSLLRSPAASHIQVLSAGALTAVRPGPSPRRSGSPVLRQAGLRFPHSRLPRADTERTARTARETAGTIETRRKPPRVEASAGDPGGGRAGYRQNGVIQSKARVASGVHPGAVEASYEVGELGGPKRPQVSFAWFASLHRCPPWRVRGLP